MTTNNIITHKSEGLLILQRETDGFFNVTKMCKAAGKKWSHYRSNASTEDYLSALSIDLDVSVSSLIDTVRGGNLKQGTWVHPKVAIHLAQWLSPEFSLKVTNLVLDWMSGGKPNTLPVAQDRKILSAQMLVTWSDRTTELKDFNIDTINSVCRDVLPAHVVMDRQAAVSAVDSVRGAMNIGIDLFNEINASLAAGNKVLS